MTEEHSTEQTEELAAVISCFGEEFVNIDSSGEELKGAIAVVSEPRSTPIIVSASEGEKHGQFKTTHLSPVNLQFHLPSHYPAEQAIIDIDCIWMPCYMRHEILKRLQNILYENVGSAILFLCYEEVKKIVDRTEITELHLEENHFARKNKMRPMEMLEAVREECEKAELIDFQSHCHDCEVCFENKCGRECVRFSPCGHIFCKECTTAYFKETITFHEISPLTCPSSGCESIVPQKLIVDFLGQVNLPHLEAFERYERILLSRFLDSTSDIAICPRIACQKPAALSHVTENLATCLVCGYSFCTRCFKAFHGIHKCNKKYDLSVFVEHSNFTWGFREVTLLEYMKATPEERIEMGWWYGGVEKLEAIMEEAINKLDNRNLLWIQENSKRCPQCNIPAQKISGCNHVVCLICKTAFCWNCLQPFQGNHFDRFPECRVT